MKECLFPRKWDAIGLPEGVMLPAIAVREHNAAVLRFEELCDSYRELELELCAAREAIEANARLIAAAPDLLAACESILAFAVAWEPLTPGDIANVRAAVAKARGE